VVFTPAAPLLARRIGVQVSQHSTSNVDVPLWMVVCPVGIASRGKWRASTAGRASDKNKAWKKCKGASRS
jgi:hypothetical protein